MGKWSKSHIFTIMSPLIGFLVLISYPSPKASTLETFQANFQCQIFVPRSWGFFKGSKMAILGLFLAKIAYLRPILALKTNI